MKYDLFCTLGPSSLNEVVIRRLTEIGATLFRINLSHTKTENVAQVISLIKKYTDVPICIDTEGAQVRTGDFSLPIEAQKNQRWKIFSDQKISDDNGFSLYPSEVFSQIQAGDLLTIDFNNVLAQVIFKNDEFAEVKILNGGLIGGNKAVSFQKKINLPPLTEKDIDSIYIAKKYGINNFALSFAHSSEDVNSLRRMIDKNDQIISKIECDSGLKNLESILTVSDGILIDRGDLSREQPIERIPLLQKEIIKMATKHHRPVYVATNLLESMVKSPTPTRAEVNDIFNTISDGARGLVLAAETAIGQYPEKCAEMVVKVICEYNSQKTITQFLETAPFSQLPSPHGGKMIKQQLSPSEAANLKKSNYKKLIVDTAFLLDSEQMAKGAYSPLTGFMGKKEIDLVLGENKLLDGTTWTMPIFLQVPSQEVLGISPGEKIILYSANGFAHSVLEVGEIFTLDLVEFNSRFFDTNDLQHPGVARVYKLGNTFLSGKVSLIEGLPNPLAEYSLCPEQTRLVFNSMGWSKVVGFHTRNLPHSGHEFVQLSAMKKLNADGLFISPVIGNHKLGDFKYEIVIEAYNELVRAGRYPLNKVFLSGFRSYPRYAGPREAVFTAICRKNYGCSYFIVGRDHAGFKDYFQPYDSIKLFERLDNLGITPCFIEEVSYNPKTQTLIEGANAEGNYKISGTLVRDYLLKNVEIPDWLLRPEIKKYIKDKHSLTENSVFY